MRTLILHHPKGHPYWQADEFEIELPDGKFYDKTIHNTYDNNGWDGCECHRIIIKQDGIYYQRCGASSGTGKTDYKEPFKIIDNSAYDQIEYAGEPLVISEELQNDIDENLK